MRTLILIILFCLSFTALSEDAVFRLKYTRIDKDSGDELSGRGTAFVSDRGLITAYHNLHHDGVIHKDITIEVSHNQWVSVKVKYFNQKFDLALLECDHDLYHVLYFAPDEAKVGDKLFLYGGKKGKPIKDYEGFLQEKFYKIDRAHLMKVDFYHGDSGGPVLNERGLVVGIAVGGITKDKGLIDPEYGLFLPLAVIDAFFEEASIKENSNGK